MPKNISTLLPPRISLLQLQRLHPTVQRLNKTINRRSIPAHLPHHARRVLHLAVQAMRAEIDAPLLVQQHVHERSVRPFAQHEGLGYAREFHAYAGQRAEQHRVAAWVAFVDGVRVGAVQVGD